MNTLRKTLLASGGIASILYVVTDLIAAVFYPGYHSFTGRVVSELMARGAPTEGLVDPLFMLYGVLMVAFSCGVWSAAETHRHPSRLHAVALLLFVYAVLGLFGPTVFDM